MDLNEYDINQYHKKRIILENNIRYVILNRRILDCFLYEDNKVELFTGVDFKDKFLLDKFKTYSKDVTRKSDFEKLIFEHGQKLKSGLWIVSTFENHPQISGYVWTHPIKSIEEFNP